MIKEFSFQICDKDYGLQLIDLGDKKFYHVHISSYENDKHEVICADMYKEPLDELYINLECLASCIWNAIEEYKEDNKIEN